VGDGAPVVVIGVHVSVVGSYLPPVSVSPPGPGAVSPPHTIISVPVHIAVWKFLPVGVPIVVIVWGGNTGSDLTDTGGRYDPTTDTWTPITTTGAPSARDEHTAVWTGTEIIVWGGDISFGSRGETNTGARYNPSTDTWTPITTTGAPSAREDHIAIWTGIEMIVWGGDTASGLTDTGARYDPSTDTWTPTPLTDPPAGRNRHTAIWTGTEMIVWGGRTDTLIDTDTGGNLLYESESSSVPPPNTPPVADSKDVIIDVNSTIVIVLAGSDGDGDSLTFSIADNPTNGTLSTITPINSITSEVSYTPVLYRRHVI